MLVEDGVGSDQFLLVSGFEGFGEDGIGVIVVEDHDILVAFAGDNRETTGLIGKNLSSDFDKFRIHKIGSDLGLGGRAKGRHDRGWRLVGRWTGFG